MRKFYLKVALNVLAIIATILLVGYELKTKGTVTGLSLIPFLVILLKKAFVMISNDWKEMMNLIANAEEV